MLHSSERRFSTGACPWSAKRKGARKRFTARVVLVAWFLMYWASSSTTKPHSTRAELRAIDAHAVVGGHDHARDIGARSASDSLASRSRVLARIVPAPENAPFVYPLRRTE